MVPGLRSCALNWHSLFVMAKYLASYVCCLAKLFLFCCIVFSFILAIERPIRGTLLGADPKTLQSGSATIDTCVLLRFYSCGLFRTHTQKTSQNREALRGSVH